MVNNKLLSFILSSSINWQTCKKSTSDIMHELTLRLSKWSDSKNGLVLILCISLLIKISIAFINPVINPDGIIYISAAKQFAAGNFMDGLAIYSMPFYPFLILLTHFFIPEWVVAAKLISVVSLCFVLIPLYLITKDLFNDKAAFWACLAFAVAP